MKNNIFMVALAALALASCANDEVINVQTNDGEAIRFRSAVTNSRGAVVETSTLASTGFWVMATNTDNSTQWTSANGMHKFVISDNQYVVADAVDANEIRWPVGKTLNFYATNLDPEKTQLSAPTNSSQPKYASFSPDATISNQIDFVYATNSGSRKIFSSSIPLNFKHALSQIEIKAKYDPSKVDYVVRVKGYKIARVNGSATFTFKEPITITSESSVTPPIGEWSALTNDNTSYASGFYGGNGYTTGTFNGLSDSGNNFISLSTTEETIAESNAEGCAMLIPQNVVGLSESGGAYLALLVQIDLKDGTPIFPAKNKNNENQRICYAGLPKYYGYIATAVDFAWEAGKKYTYVLDLTDGVGFVDPDIPDVVDPDDPEKPGNKDDDPYNPGDEIFGHAIKFTVDVEGWDTTPGNTSVGM